MSVWSCRFQPGCQCSRITFGNQHEVSTWKPSCGLLLLSLTLRQLLRNGTWKRQVKRDKGRYFFTQALLEPSRVKKGLEKFMGNSSRNGESEGERGVLLMSLIQQLWVLQVGCGGWPCTRASPAQSLGLLGWRAWDIFTFRLEDSLIFPPSPHQGAAGSVLVLQTRVGCALRWDCGTSAG